MPIDKPFKGKPDFEHFRKVIMRETRDGPVPLIELFADPEIMVEATGMDFPIDKGYDIIYSGGANLGPEAISIGIQLMDLSLAFSNAVGYDYVTMTPLVPVRRTRLQLQANPKQQGKIRPWQNEHEGLIRDRGDYEKFPWPPPDQISIFPVDYAAAKMPPGMKVMCFWPGIFEDLKLLMGIENMAIKSIEEPELLDDILEKLTLLAEYGVEKAAAHPATGALFYGEDMGFNTSLILSPKFMRQHVLPLEKRIAAACHKHDKPFLLHSCGQIDAIMKDLIGDVGIDARHSYQDNLEPVEQVYRKYGDKISILGGVDVDLLSRGTTDEVRARTRKILQTCAPGGGYCMGSGNTVTNFCKVENYYAMIDETRKWNEAHGWM